MRDALDFLNGLQANPSAFDFYAALRWLECAYPTQARIGTAQRPQGDALRFGQPPSLAFEAAMIAGFKRNAEPEAHRLDVNFFGLFGANGPLPTHLTEYVRDRLRNANDPTLSRFLDIFHHRLISLFYRSWAAAQPAVSLDRPEADYFSNYMRCLVGIGLPSMQQRDAIPDFAKLHYASRLSAQTRHAEGLAAVLSGFLKLPVSIKEFVGHWMTLPEDERCVLSASAGTSACTLGGNTVLGRKVWNCQHKFRVVMGPLSLSQLKKMLPGTQSVQQLIAWIRSYAGLSYAWDLNLILQKEELPELRLGKQSQLGWTSWLRSRPAQQDDKQLCFSPSRY
ncbi:MAG: type VI secretion system baseplate subunit TssG [Pseudomonadota bacterium]